MEYLNNILEETKRIDENDIKYINIFERPDLVYGNPQIAGAFLDFSKYSIDTDREIEKYTQAACNEYRNLKKSSSGCRLRIRTNSNRIVFKVELKRAWDYKKMTLWNSSGFDVYQIRNNEYTHKTVFGPKTGEHIFAETIENVKNIPLCIFLPLYNTIEKMYIGIEKEKEIFSVPYENVRPIIFYGNSITQGAAASRSGNCFCNIVSRKKNCDIINLSTSSGCKGLISVADEIGKLNCSGIVIDYSRNAFDSAELEKNYMQFYQRIRKWHKDIPIILMTVSNFNNRRGYFRYDDVIISAFNKIVEDGHNTFLINQKALFNEEEYDVVTVDGIHYTDIGMYRIADEICSIFNALERDEITD